MGGGEYPRARKKKLTGERCGDTFSVFGRRERWRRESLAKAEGSHDDVLERKDVEHLPFPCTAAHLCQGMRWCQAGGMRRPWVFPGGIRSHGVASTAVSTTVLCNNRRLPLPPAPRETR